ncbi:hypothetical protein RHDC4_01405 [Rhodocyclaceae bacterium]|nr:hypothetical protein RHDC4_01405 [Rhodocyclaceae bacterium]
MCRTIRFLVLLAAILPQVAAAGWREPREALDQRHTVGMFRIHYTATGADAFVGAAGGEGAAGLALRLGEQLERGHRFYAEVLGLTPPPANPRYRSLLAVDVHVLAMEGKKGSTGDEPIVYRYRHFPDRGPAITISISSRWAPGNLTPEHEVFHAYQYGYSFFKNPWFLEGMANALEAAFRPRRDSGEPLPQDGPALQRLLGRSYGAGAFWYRLMGLCDPGCAWSAEDGGASRGRCGVRFVRPFLEALQAADRAAAQARGIDPAGWPESEQRSERNNPWLLDSLAATVARHCAVEANAELGMFLEALKAVRRSLP